MYASHPGTHPAPPETPVPLSGDEAAIIGLAALAILLIPFLWPMVEHFNVMAHEGAHAVTGTVLGFPPVGGVMLHSDATGGTSFSPSIRGPRFAVTAVMGYLGPSAFGLCAAKLIETGHVITVLWIATILLVLLLFLIRRSFGLVSVPAAIAVLAIVMRYAHAGLEEIIIYALTWLLLLSGVRVALADGVRSSDSAALSATTRIPRPLWVLLWLGGTILAVIIGGKWLVLRS